MNGLSSESFWFLVWGVQRTFDVYTRIHKWMAGQMGEGIEDLERYEWIYKVYNGG